ncbi:MAG: hypothetical protein ACREMZ_16870 [Gemmatimonadales bacterium]
MGEGPQPALGAIEREQLRNLHTQIQASGNSDWLKDVGPLFADQLRRQLPDLDDATIGRVVLAIASYVQGEAQRTHYAKTLVPVWGTIVTAGLVLTQREWDPQWGPRQP